MNAALKNKGFTFSMTTDNVDLPDEFEQITIETDDGFENWQPIGAFIVPYVQQDWFEDIIRKKEAKILTK